MAKCTGCGQCWNACPSKKNPSEFDYGMGKRTAIYVPFPQAVPARPVIDREACLHLTKGKCGLCAKKCQAGAIRFDDEDRLVTEEVGAIVVATGYQLYSIGKQQPTRQLAGYGEYGYGRYPDVIDSLQFERLVSRLGPHRRRNPPAFRRPAPKTVVFLSCVGSRDNAKGISYCSKICCMYTAKHTMLYKHKVHDGAGPRVLHGHPLGRQELRRVRPPGDRAGRRQLPPRPRVENHRAKAANCIVRGVDTLAGEPLTIAADLVVLATAMRAADGVDGIGPEAQRRLRRIRLPLRIAPQAAAGRNQRRGRVCLRRLPGPEGHSRVGGPGQRGGRQGAGDVQPRQLTREPEIAKVNENLLRRLFRLRAGLPLQRYRAGRNPRPQGKTRQADRAGQRGPVHGLRHLRGRLPLEERRPGRLYRATGLRHAGEPRMSEPSEFQPKIVAYVCNWCTYLGADLAGTNRLEYPANVRIIRLPCTGRIDFNLIVKAFEMGADAVLVSGCHPGDCHYTAGNYHARRRWILFRQLLETLGIDIGRVHFSWISAAEGKKWQQVDRRDHREDPGTGPLRGLPARSARPKVRRKSGQAPSASTAPPEVSTVRQRCRGDRHHLSRRHDRGLSGFRPEPVLQACKCGGCGEGTVRVVIGYGQLRRPILHRYSSPGPKMSISSSGTTSASQT